MRSRDGDKVKPIITKVFNSVFTVFTSFSLTDQIVPEKILLRIKKPAQVFH